MLKNYVGLSCTGHDAAVAIVDSEGRIVFAEATERALQYKRALDCTPDQLASFGPLVERHCEPGAELVLARTWSDRAIGTLEAQHASVTQMREYVEAAGFPPQVTNTALREIDGYRYLMSLVSGSIARTGRQAAFDLQLASPFVQRSFTSRGYEHHLTHAAAACFTSPYDRAVCAVVDGFGEGTSCRYYAYEDGKLRDLEALVPGLEEMRNSLGLFYSTICRLCGFDAWQGEEWKVMGLAAYGKLDPTLHALMRRMLKVEGLRLVQPPDASQASLELQQCWRAPDVPSIEAADMAFTGQAVFCELMGEMLRNLGELGISKNLVLSGGCALNSSWNGRILDETGFESLYLFPAPADDGNAVGAALLAFYEDHPDRRPTPGFQTPFLGSRAAPDTLRRLSTLGRLPGLREMPGKVHERAAELLAEGRIIGWMQGRAEFGPRALGNRSILANPAAPGMKDRINALVKFREEFRPFAPAVLHEHGPEFFEHYQEAPYMERTLRFRAEARDRVPAVVHADGTGRVQTVKREWNEKYYLLIEAFRQLTGVPMVLNTSFNVMGKPIVHSVEDAVAVFFTTGLDALVIEDWIVEKAG